MRNLRFALAFSLFASSANAQPTTALTFGSVTTCLNTTSAGAVNGSAYTLPARDSSIVTAQVTMDGSSLVASIQASLDGTSWNTLGTSSFTSSGIISSSPTATRFIRCVQTSRTGGTTTTIKVGIGRSAILQGASGTLGGQLQVQNGTSTAPAIAFASENNTGIYWPSAGAMNFTIGGNIAQTFSASSFRLFSDSSSFSMGGTAANNPYLVRDGNHIFAQRNGTNPQTFRIYNTYTDASNYERLSIDWSSLSNVASILAQNAGTGSSRILDIGTAGAGALRFRTSNTVRAYFDSASGHFLFGTDNTYDIGAAGATRPRNVYAAGQIRSDSNIFVKSTGGEFYAGFRNGGVADGRMTLINGAANDFSLLQFGGTTSSFPALKRSGAIIEAKLADDSNYTTVVASNFADNNGALLSSNADGTWLMRNAAGTDFSLLQFGGTTSSFPALKRTTNLIDVRYADDSNFSNIRAGNFVGASNSLFSSPADGAWLMRNAAGTDFSMLQFGGTTNSFPAWKRVTTQLHARLADDSAQASVAVNQLITNPPGIALGSGTFAALGTPGNGTIVYCSDCTNASNPCTGSGTGAIAKRLNGAWDCR